MCEQRTNKMITKQCYFGWIYSVVHLTRYPTSLSRKCREHLSRGVILRPSWLINCDDLEIHKSSSIPCYPSSLCSCAPLKWGAERGREGSRSTTEWSTRLTFAALAPGQPWHRWEPSSAWQMLCIHLEQPINEHVWKKRVSFTIH
jgi:hypothetical protein